jgi:hypothetical protein
MSYGLCDLRMSEVLAERRLLEARKSGLAHRRRPSVRGRLSEMSGSRNGVGFARPAPGAAGRN